MSNDSLRVITITTIITAKINRLPTKIPILVLSVPNIILFIIKLVFVSVFTLVVYDI